MISTFQEEKDKEEEQLISDYIFLLFNRKMSDEGLKQVVDPKVISRIMQDVKGEALKTLITEAKEKNIKDVESLVNKISESVKHERLIHLVSDLLKIQMPPEDLSGSFFTGVLNQIGYLDSEDFYKKRETDFTYSYLREDFETEEKRKVIIDELFKGDYKKYLNAFKEKLCLASGLLFKQILLLELQNKSSEQIEEIINYLFLPLSNADYKESSYMKKAKDLFNDGRVLPLVINGQKEFCEALKSQKSKSEQNCSDDNLETLLLWLQDLPREKSKIIQTLIKLSERNKIGAYEKVNNLVLFLFHLEQDVCKTVSRPFQEPLNNKVKEYTPEGSEQIKDFGEGVKNKALEIIRSNYDKERKYILKLQLKVFKKRFITFSGVFVAILITVFGFIWYRHVNDIETIYQNTFLKGAVQALEGAPFPDISELKSSDNPRIIAEQKRRRLDYIERLNLRYFKVLEALLAPVLREKENKIQEIPEHLRSKLSDIRLVTKNLFSTNEWNEIEPLIGENVLIQLRAYGSIANFLLPELANDKSKSETEYIKEFFIRKYKKIPNENEIQPKVFIDKYDEDYKKILDSCNLMMKKVVRKKIDLTHEYRIAKNKEKKSELKTTLEAIALLECRLKDLYSRVKARHDYIIKNNTYWAVK